MSFKHPSFLALLLLIVAFAVISSAWGFELIGQYKPCGLCLQQRQPYYAALPLAALTVYASRRPAPPWLLKALFTILALVFAISLFLAIRHMGVEWKWWLGPSNCAAGHVGDFGANGSLIEALQETKVAFCDQAAARFLGLSFAGWNGVASVILLLIALLGLSASWKARAR